MASNQKQNLDTQVALAAVTTNGAPFNIPARAKQLIGHIVAANVNAATTVAAKIQHSPDKTNWYDYITFTSIVGAAGAQGLATSSRDLAVFPYLRSVITLSGTTKLADVTIDLWWQAI